MAINGFNHENRGRCAICGKHFHHTDKVARVNVEIIGKEHGIDGFDETYWSRVFDWEVIEKMHLTCLRDALDKETTAPYKEELRRLAVHDFADYLPESKEDKRPKLKVVHSA